MPFFKKILRTFQGLSRTHFPFFKDSTQCKKEPWVYAFFSSTTKKRKELSPLGSKSPVNNSWLISLTDQIENQTKSFFYCNTEFGPCHKQFPCTRTFLPISNKIDVTKLISTECKFCCYSLWNTKVWWTSRILPSCLKKNSKFWLEALSCRVS